MQATTVAYEDINHDILAAVQLSTAADITVTE